MHTNIQMEINVESVRALIASQMPQWKKYEIKPVAQQGWDNRTFHLGQTMSVRLPSSEIYAPQAEKEQHWLPKLSSKLPFQIPQLLAQGKPSALFPYSWGVYKWIIGEKPAPESIHDLSKFATDLAFFLKQLQKAETAGGPLAGKHCFFRGAPLLIYDAETRDALNRLAPLIDAGLARAVWQDALRTEWERPPVWFHGDMAIGNLLTSNGKLSAVIDFGCCGVGDPACDLAIAWTFLSGRSRQAFKSALNLDQASWQRGRGWALWKALITMKETLEKQESQKQENEKSTQAQKTLREILEDYRLEQG